MGDGKVRRVVKGFDNEGRSTIVSDGASPAIKSIPGRPDYYSTNVRRTGAAPVDITEPDLIEGHVGVSPPA
ncbi:MAG: cupin domain-containing protein, partial [Alphaproteobacteria bacterium]